MSDSAKINEMQLQSAILSLDWIGGAIEKQSLAWKKEEK